LSVKLNESGPFKGMGYNADRDFVINKLLLRENSFSFSRESVIETINNLGKGGFKIKYNNHNGTWKTPQKNSLGVSIGNRNSGRR
jgi:hypothetical protein